MTSHLSRTSGIRAALISGAVAAALVAGAGVATAGPQAGDKQVSYLGLIFSVPANWPVVDVSSSTCVRYDTHAVYLGTPGSDQHCPAHLIGRTEALLVQPATSPTSTSTDDTASHQIVVNGTTASVTATYGTDRATVAAVLASAGLPAPTPKFVSTRVSPRAAVSTLPSTVTNGTGEGFDACEAPSLSLMNAWLGTSPYTSVGIYLGGEDQSCAQPNLTASWLSSTAAAGWHFLPLYVGLQADVDPDLTPITSPQAQGTSDADTAIANAQALGLGAGNILYDDMETYGPDRSGIALAYEAAWTAELHKNGYRSGVYGSTSSAMADLVANYGGLATPDATFNAHLNGSDSTVDAAIPTADWANHQRVHQYATGDQTFNGFSDDTDTEIMDVGVAGAAAVPVDSGLVSTVPFRLLDTRNAIGAPNAPIGASQTLGVKVTGVDGIPSSVTAVVLNVTATNASGTSFLSVYPDGQTRPSVSDLNFTAGQTIPNLVTVPVVDGTVDFFNHVGTVDVLADLFGYYTTGAGQQYHQLTPTRALDTRNAIGAPKAALGTNSSLSLTVSGVGGIPATVSAVIMNVTAVSPTASSFLTVYPGTQTTVPNASNLNFSAGQTISNLVIVPVVNGTVKIFNHAGTVQVLGDILGYFTPGPSEQFTPTAPARLLDTRGGIGTGGVVAPLAADATQPLAIAGNDGIPANVTAVVLNVTAVSPSGASFLAVYPDGEARPNVSNLNFTAGQTIANLTVVPVVDGSVDFYNHAGTVDVTADVAGYYTG